MTSSSGLVIARASSTTQGNRSARVGKGMLKDTDEGIRMAKPERVLSTGMSVPGGLRWVTLLAYCVCPLTGSPNPLLLGLLWRLPRIDLTD